MAMCGIAGIVNFSGQQPREEIVSDMIALMRHRGPDDHGIFSDQCVVFGHRRLSIIDVVGSRQPLSNEDGSIWVSYNGEIYNYAELRKKLLEKGHRFSTQGDTETLVHLYEDYGEEMVHHLVGMFAFAIWDKRKRQLLLVRDRMGIKPVYYCQKGDDFIFASEPKAFFVHPAVRARCSEEGLWHYLTYRSVPAPQTLFEGISKLLPGHMLTVTDKGISERCYWDIPLYTEAGKRPDKYRSRAEITEKVESLLLTAVKRRLVSDVPVGAFLSGGVDSSVVVAMMSKLSSEPVRTYSVGFANFAFSETDYARTVAELYRTEHHELILHEDCFAEQLEKLTWLRDSPLSEPADVPLYLLAKMASREVKVLLSGEGGDELFAGYPKYAFDRFAALAGLVPRGLVRLAERALPAGFRRAEIALRSLCEKDPAERWALWFAPFSRQEKLQMLGGNNSWPNPSQQYVQRAAGCCALDGMLYTDCKLWLPDNLLDRADRMTMGASVECRVPFLDHELVELAFSLPVSVKIKGFCRKWQVKQIAGKYLPEQIIRRRKVGFSVPLARWFRGKLRQMCYERICDNNGLAGQLGNRSYLQKILDEHCANRKDHSLKIWTLLGLSIWHEVFCKDSGSRVGR
jgi:asparagine synthase (glutamine-hydrolysing)